MRSHQEKTFAIGTPRFPKSQNACWKANWRTCIGNQVFAFNSSGLTKIDSALREASQAEFLNSLKAETPSAKLSRWMSDFVLDPGFQCVEELPPTLRGGSRSFATEGASQSASALCQSLQLSAFPRTHLVDKRFALSRNSFREALVAKKVACRGAIWQSRAEPVRGVHLLASTQPRILLDRTSSHIRIFWDPFSHRRKKVGSRSVEQVPEESLRRRSCLFGR